MTAARNPPSARSIYSSRYYKENKEKIKVQRLGYHIKNKEAIKVQRFKLRQKKPLQDMISKSRSRAKEKGLDFNISQDDFLQLPTNCPVLGIPLIYCNQGEACSNSASFDRFDNSKGYVKGNTRIISHRANTLKSDGTLDEFKKIVKYLEEEGVVL
jgi:hypothetical protein